MTHVAPELTENLRSRPVHDLIAEASAAAQRVLQTLRHDPVAVVTSLVAPVVLILVFGYVLGGSIDGPAGGDYREFLVPGMFVMASFNLIPSMVATARDAGRGVVDRFRSMPISRLAVPLGQSVATTVFAGVSTILMIGCGLAVGWRMRAGVAAALAAMALLLVFQYAVTWLGMYLGLVLGNEETAAQLAPVVFPVAMVSNLFVPTTGMPGWLRTVADWNPLSAVAAAVRELFGNPGAPVGDAWPLQHPGAASLIWTFAILAVAVPLCARRWAQPSAR